jgi:hypothetical protein
MLRLGDTVSWNSISTAITPLFAILTFLGVHKFFIEPRLVARQVRKRYATALWIACKELQLHLEQINHKVSTNEINSINALKKIPDNDFKGRADWFTKQGYYATVTAYKIAVVSSWLHVYQQELLFSTYRESRAFLYSLYQKIDHLKRAFSRDTCLWYDYFDAIGSKLVDPAATVPRPLPFGPFCDRYFSDQQFRRFYDQLHMFIRLIADGKYLKITDEISGALDDLMGFLKKKNLLAGLKIERPTINPELSPSVQSDSPT